ncbi:hypothetical protein ABS71_16380 [bacterium SCN 62-11]|nr:class I SAM-dependent methyltransferase [Candidatus Eremiobacteraeota bacterium]ODT61992.1 MAG: hypothetical protein ABS71_16380 [bacterium SCN 62-11]
MNTKTWAERYAGCDCVSGTEASTFLREHLHWLPRGNALDVAMGEGRNSALLVKNGFDVLGVEREPIAIERARARCGEGLQALQLDLEAGWRPEPQAYELVVVINYLQRDLFESLQDALKPGGALIYESRTVGNFALQSNELLRVFPKLRVAAYREWDNRASFLGFR